MTDRSACPHTVRWLGDAAERVVHPTFRAALAAVRRRAGRRIRSAAYDPDGTDFGPHADDPDYPSTDVLGVITVVEPSGGWCDDADGCQLWRHGHDRADLDAHRCRACWGYTRGEVYRGNRCFECAALTDDVPWSHWGH